MESHSTNQKQLIADKIAFWVMLLVIFLVPIFFIPSGYLPLQFGKVALFYGGFLIAACAYIIARLNDGELKFPWHPMVAGFGVIALVTIVAALLSPVRVVSLIGEGFETGTALFICTAVIFSIFVSLIFTTKSRIAYAYFAFLFSVPIVMIFQLIRLVGSSSILSFNVFGSSVTTLLGGWNDLGIYFGAVALFAFIILELLDLDRWLKVIFGVVLAIALFFLSVINFTTIWYLLGSLAIIFFVYNFSFTTARYTKAASAGSQKRNVPVTSLIVIIVSVLFILIQGNLYSTIPFLNHLAITNLEVRPSWAGTWQVTEQTFKTHPVFGVGPNRFTSAWLSAKPAGINNTVFWSTDFSSGIGFVPTLASTTGILGALAWLAFFILFIWAGFVAMFAKTEDRFIRSATVASFIISLYFWIFSIFYVPSVALMILTFFFTGIFIATLGQTGVARVYTINFINDARTSFVTVLIFIALILGMILCGYAFTRKFVANFYYNKAVSFANAGTIGAAQSNLVFASTLSNDDQFYRSLAALYVNQLTALAANNSQNLSKDAIAASLRSYFANAQAAASDAISADPTNYQNWLTRAQVYGSIVSYNVTGAYTSAASDLAQAEKLDPKNPALLLDMAELDVANNTPDKAKQDIADALALKPDYTDALFYLAQIQASQNDLPSAIQSAEAAAYINPNDSGIYFELGMLRYDNKDYAGAVSAFDQAIAITPGYANAQYFLGISDYRLGQAQAAITEFQNLKSSNPDNADVTAILANLTAGRDPFAGLQPPQNQPEKAAQPPISDGTAAPSSSKSTSSKTK